MMQIMGYKLCVFIPETHLNQVKEALFKAGAGRLGNYDACSWQVLGEGQFRALKGADPYLGQIGEIETLQEYRLETFCEAEFVAKVVVALKESHPYETPAYDVIPMIDPAQFNDE